MVPSFPASLNKQSSIGGCVLEWANVEISDNIMEINGMNYFIFNVIIEIFLYLYQIFPLKD